MFKRKREIDVTVNFANPLEIHHHHHGSLDTSSVEQILTQLAQIQQFLKELKMTDAEVKVLLGKIDVTTTRIGTNVQTIGAAVQNQADVVQEVSDDIDRLIAAGQISGESAKLLQDAADKLQASSDASDAIAVAANNQVAVLTAIAAKSNPVVPEPPPAPEV